MPSPQAWFLSHPGAFSKTLSASPTPLDTSPSYLSLSKDQLLVEVAAASLNPADYKFPEMGLPARALFHFPKTPGMDFSGRVVRAGEGCSGFSPGQTVFGILSPFGAMGSLRRFVVAEASATVPVEVGGSEQKLEDAAGLGVAALTAYQTIAPYVKEGDRVFINGGGGGTGTYGIQIAKALGCHVTVSCSGAKAELCRGLGADEVVDYKSEPGGVVAALKKKGPVFQLVVDNVGNNPPDLYRSSNGYIKPGGHFVFVGGQVSASSLVSQTVGMFTPVFLHGPRAKFQVYLTKHKREDLEVLAKWFAEGKVRTVVEARFGFREVREAYDRLKGGRAAGKILVRVKGDGDDVEEVKAGEAQGAK